MRTVTFKSVFEGILRRHGMDPRGDAVSSDTGLSLVEHVNARVKRAWFAWEWPEWTITEERAFRQIWNDSRQFYQAGADGKPDEVFYIPNVATHSLVDAAYYRVKEDAPDLPPVGDPPTDTVYWEKMDSVDTYIAFDQVCRRRIGEVLSVYANNPAVCKPPRCLDHRPTENGIQVYEAGGLSTVFVRYLIPAERFTIFPYIASRTYLRGDLVYLADQGESYQAIQVTTDKDPATETSFWRQCLFPEVLAQYVRAGAFSDSLRESDTSDERDPVLLQIRGQQAAAADGEAEDEITRQMQRLQAQGQHYSYLPFGVVVGKRACGADALCAVPGYVLQGGGAYGYGPIAPTGTGVTTIGDQCETEWGYIPPAPPVVTIRVPIANQRGMVQLMVGQGYADVVFHSSQTNANWILVECEIVNTTDATPLNITPGIITSRTLTGFRIQLEGLPDTSNYFLRWAINGNIVPPAPATTYALSGPTSGRIGAAATFTVELLPDTTVEDPVTITPSDGGGGGTFSPTSVELTSAEPSATFTYTPGLYGNKTISTTNDGALTDPASITFTSLASTYTLTGPTSGNTGVASTNFTVALPVGGVVTGTVTVTPSSGSGGGTFTPTTVALTTASPSATFTYTPAADGTKTLSVTNDGGLTNPGNISYVASTPFTPASIAGLKGWWKADSLGLANDAIVVNWFDSSSNANTAFEFSGFAKCKTNIINGLPVVRFVSTNTDILKLTTPIVTTSGWTVFAVMKKTTAGVSEVCAMGVYSTQGEFGPTAHNTLYYVGHAGSLTPYGATDAAFHVLTGTNTPTFYINGVSQSAGSTVSTGVAGSFDVIGFRGSNYSDGDIAEVLVYQGVLGSTDRANVENYLRTKYAL